jgi:hypothetical protein
MTNDCPKPSIDSAEFFRWCRLTLDGHAENPATFAINDPKKNFVMEGILPPHIRELVGTESDSLILSRQTYIEHLKHGITPSEYAKVLGMIKDYSGDIYHRGERHIGLPIETEPEQFYRLIIKTTKNHSEVYLASLCKLSDKSLKTFCHSRRIYPKKRLPSGSP